MRSDATQPGGGQLVRELPTARFSVPGRGSQHRVELADRTDTALRQLWHGALDGAGLDATGMALAAVGSLGRRDGGPTSDLDLLLIHDGRVRCAGEVVDLSERLWYPLWDAGLDLDHAVRTLNQCRHIASADLAAAVGLLDLRCVAGDEAIVAAARTVVLADWRSAARKRLPDLLESTMMRAAHFGELAHVIEPDLKQARGGLRDAVVLRALTASWLTDRLHGPVDAAYAHLLDVRDELAHVTRRHSTRLLRGDAPEVAARLGHANQDELLVSLAQSGRVISHALDTAVRHARQSLRGTSKALRPRIVRGRPRPAQLPLVAPGVAQHDGELVLSGHIHPEQDAGLSLRVAAAAAQHNLPISPVTAASLVQCPPLPEPWPETTQQEMLTLLRAGEEQVPVWEALDLAGVVTAWIPEWVGVRNRPQRSSVHRYTVDRHLVQTVANLAGTQDQNLLWAALLHDIGKIAGAADHSVTGADIADVIVHRVGLSGADRADVVLLVRHHLLLAETATSEDVSDSRVIARVADALDGRTDLVQSLRALTEADARAAGPKAWTTWRATLVDTLTAGVLHALT